jgi:hypothetical protein
MNADENAVASILKDYETALKGSDNEAALKLYAQWDRAHHDLSPKFVTSITIII